ncbi:uncharacterized protein NPIL_129251 [Nephila pilipes]|uniref:Transmembrane protein 107 n=1 Tax=Nephila pilipes TaxID=299642 RepID=A0A8X6I966_NEPPI|nr:uncharacterized protein NPIL_129251 [Nephila pilipes]
MELIVKENMTEFLNVKDGELQVEYLQEDLNEIINRYTIVFSISTVLLTMEILFFLGGFSMFMTWQNEISIFCHFIGTCLLFFLLYLKWNEELFYISFLLCVILPFAAETFLVVNYLLIKV